jgi:hypothetical protein
VEASHANLKKQLAIDSGIRGQNALFRLIKIGLYKNALVRPGHGLRGRTRGLGLLAFGSALALYSHSLPSVPSSAPTDPETHLEVRLKTPLTSYSTKPGTPFECVVIRSLVSNNVVLIPMGATVHGHVSKATSVGLGIRHERASLDLVFDDFVTPDGRMFPLYATLAAVDNSRERVKSGHIRGVIAANQPNQIYFGIWHSPSLGMLSRSLIGLTGISHQISSALSLGPAGAGGILALRLALFRFPEPEIQFAPGADMRLKVNSQLQPGVDETPTPRPAAAPDGVSEWLRKEPFSIDRRDNRPVGDMVNMAFLGSRLQLESAFSASGWAKADPQNRKTKKQAYYAFNAMRAYVNAPVSALFYKGMLPELVFEKSLNTVTKRHHIRVWYAGVVEGHELWLGAATHDTGGTFNPHYFRFTHKIDPNVDKERDKVVTDMTFAGCTEPEMRVDRQSAASNGSDRSSITDGSASVLQLTDCEPNDLAPFVFRKPLNPPARLLRRMILEARNHIERENVYYWTFQAVMSARNHIFQTNNQAAAQ